MLSGVSWLAGSGIDLSVLSASLLALVGVLFILYLAGFIACVAYGMLRPVRKRRAPARQQRDLLTARS